MRFRGLFIRYHSNSVDKGFCDRDSRRKSAVGVFLKFRNSPGVNVEFRVFRGAFLEFSLILITAKSSTERFQIVALEPSRPSVRTLPRNKTAFASRHPLPFLTPPSLPFQA